MKFDLQLLAEGDGGGENSETSTAENPASENQSAETSTENNSVDIQAIIDAAISKAKTQWENDYKQREEQRKKEEARLSKMSDDERQKAELENMRQELESQKAAFEREKLENEMKNVLAKRNLPIEFTDFLIAENNEKTLERITTFEKKFKKAVEDALTEKLKGKAPQVGGTSVDASKSVKNGFMQAIFDSQIKI